MKGEEGNILPFLTSRRRFETNDLSFFDSSLPDRAWMCTEKIEIKQNRLLVLLLMKFNTHINIDIGNDHSLGKTVNSPTELWIIIIEFLVFDLVPALTDTVSIALIHTRDEYVCVCVRIDTQRIVHSLWDYKCIRFPCIDDDRMAERGAMLCIRHNWIWCASNWDLCAQSICDFNSNLFVKNSWCLSWAHGKFRRFSNSFSFIQLLIGSYSCRMCDVRPKN